VPHPNVAHEPLRELPLGPKLIEKFYPNFHIVVASLKDYYERINVFREKIEAVHGFTPEQIVTYFFALSHYITKRYIESLSARLMLYQRGYWLSEDVGNYVQAITPFFQHLLSVHFGKEISMDEAYNAVRRLTNHLTWRTNHKNSISLHDRQPFRLIFPTQFGVLVDFSSIPAVLASLFNELAPITGQVGELKGTSFEKYVIECLENEELGLKFWLCQEDIELVDGTRTDVDVSFTIGKYLFVIECKAYGFNRALDRGEPDALDTRRKQVSKSIKKLTEICEGIATNKLLDHSLPDKVQLIIPILCMPYPHYIHRIDGRYFVTSEMPRVCTVKELIAFIRSGSLESIEVNEYNLKAI
jgi:hypothetical protein